MRKRVVLDAYCGQGGCTKGFQDAGFEVVGVDINPQPRYVGDEFIQADAIEFILKHGDEFDLIHASPPCQVYSETRHLINNPGNHPDLVAPTREALQTTGRPYVIENVPGAPLINPLMLCGTMFTINPDPDGYQVIRHRLFETWPVALWPPAPCSHNGKRLPMWWTSRQQKLEAGKKFKYLTVVGKSYLMPEARAAMGIDWMNRTGMSQAIPPAFTRYIGLEFKKQMDW